MRRKGNLPKRYPDWAIEILVSLMLVSLVGVLFEMGVEVGKLNLEQYFQALNILKLLCLSLSTDEIKCSDQDFFIAQQLTKVYIEHSICIFEKLPKSEGGLLIHKTQNTKVALYGNLTEEFEYSQALEQGELLKVSPKTVRNYINSYIEAGVLTKEKHGHFTKTNVFTFYLFTLLPHRAYINI